MAVAGGGIELAIDTIAVELASTAIGNEDVPVVAGAISGGVELDDAFGRDIVGTAEKQEFNAGCGLRIDAEIGAVGVDG